MGLISKGISQNTSQSVAGSAQLAQMGPQVRGPGGSPATAGKVDTARPGSADRPDVNETLGKTLDDTLSEYYGDDFGTGQFKNLTDPLDVNPRKAEAQLERGIVGRSM